MNETELRKLKSDIETAKGLLDGVADAVDRLTGELQERTDNEVRLMSQIGAPSPTDDQAFTVAVDVVEDAGPQTKRKVRDNPQA